MKKRVFSVLLILCMLLPAFNGLSVIALDTGSAEESLPVTEEPIEITNAYNKIHFYFDTEAHATIDDAAELAAAFASVKNDYAAAVMTADGGDGANENVYITVQFASDYMETEKYKEYVEALASAETAEQRDLVKMRRNAYSKSYHQAIIDENLPILAEIPYTAVNAVDYSSFVTLTVPAAALDTAVLTEIAENANILHISLTDGFEAVADDATTAASEASVDMTSWDEVLKCIGAYNAVGGTLTGEGIKIGVYEAGGVCDRNHPNLEGKDITLKNASTTISDHATQVTSIIALMAPKAEFYVSRTGSIGIAWFIEQGCDVVNCSFSFYNNPSADGMTYTVGKREYRYDYDAIYDYQVEMSGVVVVKSAGNTITDNTRSNYNPDGQVVSPGYAYNVITVGGIDYSETDEGWVHAERASYVSSGGIMKPNIAAPYSVTIPEYETCYGTSYSAPLVTACVALLMDSNSRYIGAPEFVFATLASTANETADFVMSWGQNMYDFKVGTGVVDLGRMLNGGVFVNTISTANTASTTTYEVYLEKGQEIQIGFAWLVTVEDTDNNASEYEYVYCTNYNLNSTIF